MGGRVELIKYSQKHPEIMASSVDENNGLLFITGLPRTGSTFLQTLLSLDPNGRTPRTWEMWYPVPPAEGEDNSKHPHVVSMRKDINMVTSSFALPIAVKSSRSCGVVLGGFDLP